jgi:hypothetical protein
MAEFVPGTPVVTREPVVTVDAGLRPGRHVFRLVVVDDNGQQSAPDERIVTVNRTRPVDPTIPTRPADPITVIRRDP